MRALTDRFSPRGDAAERWTRSPWEAKERRPAGTPPPDLVYAIFVGGANDANNRNVKSYYESLARMGLRYGQYFSWLDRDHIAAEIGALADRAVTTVVVGHSYGGDTAAHAILDSGRTVALLVTVDPVSRTLPSFPAVRAATGTWINIDAAVAASEYGLDDTIAALGNSWDDWPSGYADDHIVVPLHHAQFDDMLETAVLDDGRSVEEMLMDLLGIG